MPEGPSIVILREEASPFAGQIIRSVQGNSRKLDLHKLLGCRVRAVRSWGKHFLLELEDFSLRVHLMLFGSYRINQRKESAPRLALGFDNGELNFYGCSLQYLERPLEEIYDWRSDVMDDQWQPSLALRKLRAMPQSLICDALLDQAIFSGAGNIFKNEVLFRTRVHPLSTVGSLSAGKLRDVVRQMRVYGAEFLAWKKAHELRKHWQAHNQTSCPRCRIPFSRAHLGKTHRRSFFCEKCQRRYAESVDSH